MCVNDYVAGCAKYYHQCMCSGPFAGGILAMPLAGTYEMPTGGIGTWYAPRGHTRIADKDAKLIDFLDLELYPCGYRWLCHLVLPMSSR